MEKAAVLSSQTACCHVWKRYVEGIIKKRKKPGQVDYELNLRAGG